MTHDNKSDVLILGTGIAGTLLGAILSRAGLSVTMLEQGSHPRFTIGESTIPETTFLFRILARRYDVPEIEHLSNYFDLRANVSAACGIKRNFTFAFHRNGAEHRGEETSQFLTFAPPVGPDVHLFRQDVDAYVLNVAIKYGATYLSNVEAKEISFSDDEVRVRTRCGREFRSRFIVDAGGMRAPVATALKLRDEKARFRTRSRSIFTHMIGVKPYDEVGPSSRAHGLPSPMSQGTLHHIIDEGWMWVIPFDNHPKSTNRLCSIGVTYDLNRPQNGTAGGSPEEEFAAVIRRYPSLAKQFRDARSVRGWVGTGQATQYSSSQIVGDRFCLIPHAAAFVDPLFSSGLSVAAQAINALAHRLIEAMADNRFARERFEHVETWTNRNFDYYDRLVSCSFKAFKHFELWNAWQRLWMQNSFLGMCTLLQTVRRAKTANGDAYRDLSQSPYRGVQGTDFEPAAKLFAAAADTVDAADAGQLSPRAAAEKIYDLLRGNFAPGNWELTNPENRCPAGPFTLLPMVKIGMWGVTKSPASIREHFFHTPDSPLDLLGMLWGAQRSELGRSTPSMTAVLRDALSSWTDEWKTER